MKSSDRLPGSFRDPSGFVFRRDGILYRQVNYSYQEEYDYFIASGLYGKLVGADLIVEHQDRAIDPADPSIAYKILEPQPIEFISYPYEWSFSQLKDAALLTLRIQRLAIEGGQVLKDASAFNVQFERGRPIWIDTLSFERLREGEPWVAYRQFCQHFLAPLALVAYRNVRLNSLLRTHIDGISLDLASQLLPLRTWFKIPLLMHVHLHAKAQQRFAGQRINRAKTGRRMGRASLLGLNDSLRSAVQSLHWKTTDTPWSDYSETHDYSPEALQTKLAIVGEFLDRTRPQLVWDLGANVGTFSRLASQRDALSIAFDSDPGAVELNYLAVKRERDPGVLPLVMDLTNPSPALGWAHQERDSLLDRASADVVMALALIHHLAISNNLPLTELASLLSRLGSWLIVEFVPKEDSQAQKLLVSRADIFTDYNLQGFESAFAEFFEIESKRAIKGSGRAIYLMRAKTR